MTSAARSAGPAAGDVVPDRSVREAVVTGSAAAVSVAVLIWGAIYLALGDPGAASYPFGFLALSIVNLFAYRRHRNFKLFTHVEVVAILVTPFLLMLHLGGLIASGAVGLWSLLGPIGGLLLIGHRFATGTFVVYVVFVAIGLWADQRIQPPGALSTTSRDVFLLLNLLGVSLVAFWAMRIFLIANDRLATEQRRLRTIERSYVAQEAMLRQQDRLATLGRLSAGVAHELNNPAAAAGRATQQLGSVVNRLVDEAVTLLRLGVGAEGLSWVRSIVDTDASSSPLDLADREESIGDWLSSRSVEDPWDVANALAVVGFDAEVLNQATERYSERQIVGAVQWIADVARAQQLLAEVNMSASRISQIVGALKGYSHMDGAGRAPVDLVRGIEDTLIILRSQLTGVEVETRFDPDLPRVLGNAGELNQVWTNLLANAAEALDGAGRIVVAAMYDGSAVRIEVIDDGPGIPKDLIEFIFDPFVTSKAPGEGTGLGLNLTHQIVTERHRGSISVDSRPGNTRFTVSLPGSEAVDE